MTTYAEKLLDRARQRCYPSNYAGLAARLGVSRQWVSRWKNGHDPIPYNDFRILAQMAQVNEEEWWLLLQHDQADIGIKPKLWALIERLGIAASLAILISLGTPSPSQASTLNNHQGMHYANFMVRCTIRLRKLLTAFWARWHAIRSAGNGTSPLLA